MAYTNLLCRRFSALNSLLNKTFRQESRSLDQLFIILKVITFFSWTKVQLASVPASGTYV